MLDAVRRGTAAEGIEGITVTLRPALAANAVDVLAIGYMSGALKHFFDQVYYPCRDASKGKSYGLFVHGNQDLAGAIRGVESIATGMGWRRVVDPVEVRGTPTPADLKTCWELGATVAAQLMG